MKKIWDPEKRNLCIPGHTRFTMEGLFHYWGSIDNAIEFNDKLRAKADAKTYQDMPLKKQPRNLLHKTKKYSWTKSSTNEELIPPKRLSQDWWKRKRQLDEELSDSDSEEYRFRLPCPKSLKF